MKFLCVHLTLFVGLVVAMPNLQQRDEQKPYVSQEMQRTHLNAQEEAVLRSWLSKVWKKNKEKIISAAVSTATAAALGKRNVLSEEDTLKNSETRGWLSKKWKESKSKIIKGAVAAKEHAKNVANAAKLGVGLATLPIYCLFHECFSKSGPMGKREIGKIAEMSQYQDFEEAIKRSWLKKQWHKLKKHKDAIVDGVISGAASVGTVAAIGAIGKREDFTLNHAGVTELKQVLDIDDALMRSWLSDQWKKYNESVIGGIISGATSAGTAAAVTAIIGALGKREEHIPFGDVEISDEFDIEDTVMRSWLSHQWKKHKNAIIGGIVSGAAKVAVGAAIGKREDNGELIVETQEFEEAIKRSWLKKQWHKLKKHKDAIIDGVLSGAASVATVAAIGKREDADNTEFRKEINIDDAVMRSWLSHQWKKHKNAIIGGIVSGAAKVAVGAAIGKREENNGDFFEESELKQAFDIDDAVMRSWLGDQLKKYKTSIIGGILSGAASAGAAAAIGAIGKREEHIKFGNSEISDDFDAAVMQSWLDQLEKYKKQIIGGAVSAASAVGAVISAIGKREEYVPFADVKIRDEFDIDDAVMRSWLSHHWKKHKNAIIGGIVSGAAKVAVGAAVGKREENDELIEESQFEEAIKRSWLKKQWHKLKKHKDAIIDGVLSGAASVATVAAIGKREYADITEFRKGTDIDDAVTRNWVTAIIEAIGKRDVGGVEISDEFDIEDAVMRSWLSHQWKKHKNAIIGGIVSGAAKVAVGAAVGK